MINRWVIYFLECPLADWITRMWHELSARFFLTSPNVAQSDSKRQWKLFRNISVNARGKDDGDLRYVILVKQRKPTTEENCSRLNTYAYTVSHFSTTADTERLLNVKGLNHNQSLGYSRSQWNISSYEVLSNCRKQKRYTTRWAKFTSLKIQYPKYTGEAILRSRQTVAGGNFSIVGGLFPMKGVYRWDTPRRHMKRRRLECSVWVRAMRPPET